MTEAAFRRTSLGIGDVLSLLQQDFPDVSISKLRFLEAEGLVEPERTPAGYRKYSAADVDRLRYVLRAQRDHYLPLRVIREHLDALDRGLTPPALAPVEPAVPQPARVVDPVQTAGFFTRDVDLRMSRRELLAAAEIDEPLMQALEEHGLVRAVADPGQGPTYAYAALRVAALVRRMHAYGIEPRHLRGIRIAADRQSGLLEQAVLPLARHRDAQDPGRALGELASLSVDLLAALLKTSLASSPILATDAAGSDFD